MVHKRWECEVLGQARCTKTRHRKPLGKKVIAVAVALAVVRFLVLCASGICVGVGVVSVAWFGLYCFVFFSFCFGSWWVLLFCHFVYRVACSVFSKLIRIQVLRLLHPARKMYHEHICRILIDRTALLLGLRPRDYGQGDRANGTTKG